MKSSLPESWYPSRQSSELTGILCTNGPPTALLYVIIQHCSVSCKWRIGSQRIPVRQQCYIN
jgi:hypothetical protein